MTTPSCEVDAAGMIELYFYGELHDPARAQVHAHLRECAVCRQTLGDLGRIRMALAGPHVSSPPAADWSGFMADLEARLRDERPAADRPRPSGWQLGRRPSWPTASLSMAAAAALVLVSLLVLAAAGSRWFADAPSTGARPPVSAVHRTAVPPEADRALVSLSSEHFQRSKLVVLGLATRDAAAGSQVEWGYERDLAASLLSDTHLYRRAAEERGMSGLAGVMRDLELVLLEASMAGEPDAEALASVQRLIRHRDLVAKMNVAHVALADNR